MKNDLSKENTDVIPRRRDQLRLTRAERFIQDAQYAVEAAGVDPLLTEAGMLLRQAFEKVADWTDSRL